MDDRPRAAVAHAMLLPASMRALLFVFVTLVGIALAVAGCASDAGDEGDDGDVASADDVAEAEALGGSAPPIFVWYGHYHDADTPDVVSPTTYELLVPHAESVIVTSRAPDDVGEWRARGGKVALRVPRFVEGGREDTLETHLGRSVDDAAIAIEAVLARYDYVAIDELNDVAEPGAPRRDGNGLWRDGGVYARRFSQLLARLAADGFDRRVILYVNAYDMPGRMRSFTTALRACVAHCRVLAAEVYLSTGSVLAPTPRADAPGHCDRRLACFGELAREIALAAPGAERRTISVLGVGDVYTGKRSDAFCGTRATPGSLRRQITTLRGAGAGVTRKQPGLGGYAPFHVTWGQALEAECLKARIGAYAWPKTG